MDNQKVVIFDTTLRDGEQSAGVSFSKQDKLDIAGALAAMGVDVIEAGFPAASAGEADAVAAVAREILGAGSAERHVRLKRTKRIAETAPVTPPRPSGSASSPTRPGRFRSSATCSAATGTRT